ncbi:hypothetical protein [Nevskia sp.]|uniref:hypothetical protein n=1 Tax=Nevskia sp. TaxID=1929292 RepID=UPI0025D1682A|nr:hypothetical protein [Nevskia sp.]
MDGTQAVHLWFEGVAQAAPFVFGVWRLKPHQKLNAKAQRKSGSKDAKKGKRKKIVDVFLLPFFLCVLSFPFAPLRLTFRLWKLFSTRLTAVSGPREE